MTDETECYVCWLQSDSCATDSSQQCTTSKSTITALYFIIFIVIYRTDEGTP